MTATRRPASSTVSSQAAEWNDGPAKLLPARDGGEGRAVELAHRADDRVELLRRLDAVGGPHGHGPPMRGVVEAGLGHLAVEADARPEVQLLGRRLQVGQEVGLGREPRDPVVGLGEGEAVELVGHVDPAARVDVLEPGAAHVAVLLEHGDVDAGLAQPVRRRQARGAGADHGAAERAADVGRVPASGRRGSVPSRASSSVRKPSQCSVDSAPTRKPKICRRSSGASVWSGGPMPAWAAQRGRRPAPGLVLLLAVEAASRDEQLGLVGRELVRQQREVARSGGPRRTGAGGRRRRRTPPATVPRRRPLRLPRPHPW